MAANQLAEGNANVQIADVVGSTIQITYQQVTRRVPLERARIERSGRVAPSELLRARSGVIPYSVRAELLEELVAWAGSEPAFAACVIGGRGGSGKTRLGVELCERTRAAGWLSGLLKRGSDAGAHEALIEVPTRRLVVVDYAESRVEQLAVLLPELAAAASDEHSVRVLLLVRAAGHDGNWTRPLRYHSDALDAVLDQVDERALDNHALSAPEREALFVAAAVELDEDAAQPAVPDELAEPLFATPLPVVVAAYLAVHGASEPLTPTSSGALFDELLVHEQRYWEASAEADGLACSRVLRQRVVALATLTGAIDSEATAVERLRLLPDLATVTSERVGELARWASRIYQGPGWWNALEPDRIGEHLVARTFASGDDAHPAVHAGRMPEVLTGVLRTDDPRLLVGPLDLFARAMPERPELAEMVIPVVRDELQRLCELAVEQVAGERDLDLLLGGATLAATLDRLISPVRWDAETLSGALKVLPRRQDVILGALALTLTSQLVRVQREYAAFFESELAGSLTNLSVMLGFAGRRGDSVQAIEEAVGLYRRLVTADLQGFQPNLARSLNNLSLSLGEVGRRSEALRAIGESVEILRELAAADPATFEPYLAASLTNLSDRLAAMGLHAEGLAASAEAAAAYQRLAAADPRTFEPDVAASLTNLSVRLAEMGRHAEGLEACEGAVRVYRRLVATDPAAFEPSFAGSLNALSMRFGEMGRPADGLAASEEAVRIHRRLAAVEPAAFEPDLAMSLVNLSNRWGELGRLTETEIAIREATELYRQLAAVEPAAFEPNLAMSLTNLAGRLTAAGQVTEGLLANEEAVAIYRRLAAANPAAFEPELARSLNNRSMGLAGAGSDAEALAAIEEAVPIYRRLADATPDAFEPLLALSLSNLANRLGDAGRYDEAAQARADADALSEPGGGGTDTPRMSIS